MESNLDKIMETIKNFIVTRYAPEELSRIYWLWWLENSTQVSKASKLAREIFSTIQK